MSHKHVNRMILVFAILVGAALPGAPVHAAPPDPEDALQIFNRDVYVLDGVTLRNPTADTSPDAQLYSSVGAALPLTWGEWSQASATATARVMGSSQRARTDVRIQLSGLIPGGVYSIFYGTFSPDSENPLCPGVERTLPLTAFHPDSQLPDASSFVADANGRAEYHGQVEGDLLQALQVFYTVIYHFDGMTYHPLPNRGEYLTQGEGCRSSFGEDAMRQLLIFQKY